MLLKMLGGGRLLYLENHYDQAEQPRFQGSAMNSSDGCAGFGEDDGHKPCLVPSPALPALSELPVAGMLGKTSGSVH